MHSTKTTLISEYVFGVPPHSELDLSKYVVNPNHPPPVYDLYAVINHYGGLGGGHCKCGCEHVGVGVGVTMSGCGCEHVWVWVCACGCVCVGGQASCPCTCVDALPLFLHLILRIDTAFCQNKDTDKWYSFDDSHVSETDPSHVMVRICVHVWQFFLPLLNQLEPFGLTPMLSAGRNLCTIYIYNKNKCFHASFLCTCAKSSKAQPDVI